MFEARGNGGVLGKNGGKRKGVSSAYRSPRGGRALRLCVSKYMNVSELLFDILCRGICM